MSYRPTHLLLYAAPVTRKMLHFTDLKFYAVPSLPSTWQALTWLRIELGIFAGKLYFDFSEYSSLLKFLGVTERSEIPNDDEDYVQVPRPNSALASEEEGAKVEGEDVVPETQRTPRPTFTQKPLHFLQEWLALRRKGQDFAQTPMGFVCQDKPLLESHPFFGRVTQEIKEPVDVKRSRVPGISEEDDEVDEDFCGDETYGVEVGIDEADNFDDNDLVSEDGGVDLSGSD